MNLPNLFKIYLKTQGASPNTLRNYIVDINHFFTWLGQKTGIHHQVAGQAIFKLFTQETIGEYKTDLLTEKTPPSTINRRLSTLRKFSQFSQEQGWLETNPTSKIKNISQQETKSPAEKVLKNFRNYLEQEKASPLTIKNYLSDLRHFLAWLEVG